MPLQIYDEAKILEYMSANDRFKLWRPNDDVPGNGFSAKIEQTETVSKFLDTTIIAEYTQKHKSFDFIANLD